MIPDPSAAPTPAGTPTSANAPPAPAPSASTLAASAPPAAPHHIAPLLERGVASGIISAQQQAALLALAGEETTAGDSAGPERPRGFNAVTVAYGLGALLVLFASGWFLVDRWAKLGPWGVLATVAVYAVVLALGAQWLMRRGFVVAGQLCVALAVSLAPLVAWAGLTLAGRWPDPASGDPLLRDRVWMGWQWLVADLSLLLAALLVLRRHPLPAVAWPAAVALWATCLHLGDALRGEGGAVSFDRFLFLADGLALLVVADLVERWQRRAKAGDRAGDAAGDFAGAFWAAGLLASAVGYLAIWGRADDAWRHLLLPIALGLVALSLYLRRRLVLVAGVAGVVGYLGYLAEDVFREYLSFPVLLAALGLLVIALTVWTQLRFPALVARIDASRASDARPLPWSAPMSALPLVTALALAALALRDAAEEREQEAFRQRWYLLRLHSGSLPGGGVRGARAPGARAPRPAPPIAEPPRSAPPSTPKPST